MEEEKIIIKFKAVIEILGKPKEHVEETLKKYIEHIKEDKNYTITSEHHEEPVKQDDDMFSTFAELDIETNSIENVNGFCFDYMPSSVDIISPMSLTFKTSELTNISNDLMAKLHTMDMALKKLKNENDFLKRNTGAIIFNIIKIALFGKKLNIEQLSKVTGINTKELEHFVNTLEKDGSIAKDGDLYYLKEREKDAGAQTTG